MGSASLLDTTTDQDAPPIALPAPLPLSSSGMENKREGKFDAVTNVDAKKVAKKDRKGKKRDLSKTSANEGEEPAALSRKLPRRGAACVDFKEKPVRISEKSLMIDTSNKDHQCVDDETEAVGLTCGSADEGRPNRRLTEFIFHDADGIPQPFEMSEVNDLFISGIILPLDKVTGKEKEKGVKCQGFGRIESWNLSGYEDGSPVIWASTDIADYDCIKPAGGYKKYYDRFYEKARVCVEVYKKLSKFCGGNPNLSIDELLAGVVRSMNGSKCFSGGASIRDFIISNGVFIYNQLIGLDETSKKNEQTFAESPVLVALRDESSKRGNFVQAKAVEATNSGGVLTIGKSNNQHDLSPDVVDEDEDAKLAKLLHEEEYWQTMKKKRNQGSTAKNKVYIQINEDEIANDYPLPAYYKTSVQEADEFILFESDMDVYNSDELPRSMLHNWSLYNSDSRLISLELLPMKPCAEIDVTIFGSGVMTADDGSGFCLDEEPGHSSAGGSGAANVDGIPIYLSAIKEWMIEFGSSMVFISIRTDMAWYRLGRPSKQYGPWYEPVLKTAKLAISIITMLKEQSRVSRLSFSDVIKKVSEFEEGHPAYLSSNLVAVERYVVVHGQIILQQFAEFPDEKIKKCAFVVGLAQKMEERRHTKWLVKKKKVMQKSEANLNPRSAMAPAASKRKIMQATTTRLINRIWGEYYSNYSPEGLKDRIDAEVKEEEEVEEQEEVEEDDVEDENVLVPPKPEKVLSLPIPISSSSTNKEIKWDADSVGKTTSGEALYKQALVRGDVVVVGGAVLVEDDRSDGLPGIYFVEYMFETFNGDRRFHGRVMQLGSQTVLGNTADEREVFLTNECMEFKLEDVKQVVTVDIRLMPWGHQHRKDNANILKLDRARAEERKKKGLPNEYYCKSLYCPEKGAFFSLSRETLGQGSGCCSSCTLKEIQRETDVFKVTSSKTELFYKGTNYSVDDFVYVSADNFDEEKVESGTFKSGRNVGLKAYVVCQLLELIIPKVPKKSDIKSTQVKVRKFYRPEDVSSEKAYCSDIRELYYSEDTHVLPIETIQGKCEVRKKHDLPSFDAPAVFEHIFFCERFYDPSNGSLKLLPAHIKLRYSTLVDQAANRKKKGKSIEAEKDEIVEKHIDTPKKRLATLDIFAGCGGLSEGLEQAGASLTKWAIEYEEPAGDAFKLNHPESLMFINNCNVILRAAMEKCGDLDDCISTSEAAELAALLDEDQKNNLPVPGQVDFINGGPPCQGFSGMNRFNQSSWSQVQCEMILAFLSFADFYRPKYFLLENVRNFVSFNKGQTFRLTLASLLEMGYQVRFGILEAGAYGVSQSRKRAFIWAASPEDTLPEWPEPMHVFNAPELKITLSENVQYAAVKSTACGAPFRAVTVRDTIGDLPPVENGASRNTLEYKNDPVSWFQKKIRGDMIVLTDHISKEMNELNLIRCQHIPKRPGADWHDLPEEKVKLSNGQLVDLIPWCLPNTAKRHNQWKGLFGRLDWEGNFPTSITDPQPMGKVGMCFHPDQDRILTVRECARSQGFPDSYKFSGNIQHRHRQIGNAVPPTLAYALGRKLKEVIDKKRFE